MLDSSQNSYIKEGNNIGFWKKIYLSLLCELIYLCAMELDHSYRNYQFQILSCILNTDTVFTFLYSNTFYSRKANLGIILQRTFNFNRKNLYKVGNKCFIKHVRVIFHYNISVTQIWIVSLLEAQLTTVPLPNNYQIRLTLTNLLKHIFAFFMNVLVMSKGRHHSSLFATTKYLQFFNQDLFPFTYYNLLLCPLQGS